MREINDHTQKLLTESPYVRQKFMSNLNTTSLAKYEQTVESYRDLFYREVIGKFDEPLLGPQCPLAQSVPRLRNGPGTRW